MAGTALKFAAPYVLAEVLAAAGLGAAAASRGGRNGSNETSGLPQGSGRAQIYNLQPAPAGASVGAQPSSSSSEPYINPAGPSGQAMEGQPDMSSPAMEWRTHFAWLDDINLARASPDQVDIFEGLDYDLAYESKLSAAEMADLNLASERMARQMTTPPIDYEEFHTMFDEALTFVGAQEQAPLSRFQFARRLLLAGVSLSTLRGIGGAITARYGNTQAARAIASQWVLKRLKKYKKAAIAAGVSAVAGGVGGAIGSAVSSGAVSREGKGDIIEVEKEIDEAAADADIEGGRDLSVRAPHGTPWWISPVKPLPGSVSGTAAPNQPLGPIDNVIPRSEPSIPSSRPVISSLPPGGSVFTDNLSGDSLSERPSMPSANVLRTSITTPPALNFVGPSESYQPIDYGKHSSRSDYYQPTPNQNLKRKATEFSTHKERGLENQITQNYDPGMVPALPSSVTADTSLQWKEYTPPFKGYNVSLTEAPGVVGIGFDAQDSERKLAMESPASGKEVGSQQGQAPQTPAPQVNAANATNPSLRNYGKENVTPTQNVPLQSPQSRP